MGIDFQLHRASVDTSRGFRQFQKADKALYDDKVDSAVRHLNKGLDYFDSALGHLAKAEDDAYKKAGSEIDKGNKELKKSIDEYGNGKTDSAASHYAKALDDYDAALDLIGG